MTETWLAVSTWEGVYEVSDLGRVRSLNREIEVLNPRGVLSVRRFRGRVLAASGSKNGYPLVSFTAPGRVREYRYVHELVCTAFHGVRPYGLEVCHRDGVRSNCAASNLRWGTRSSNALDRHEHGTMNQARGEEHAKAKLTEDAVKFIRGSSMSSRALAEIYGVHKTTIEQARSGINWKHVR